MKLQVAMDLLTVEDALELAGKVAEYVDIIELGTPLIKAAGLSAVTAVKAAHPGLGRCTERMIAARGTRSAM